MPKDLQVGALQGTFSFPCFSSSLIIPGSAGILYTYLFCSHASDSIPCVFVTAVGTLAVGAFGEIQIEDLQVWGCIKLVFLMYDCAYRYVVSASYAFNECDMYGRPPMV
jgi:hypothetical protein